ncbi:MAG: CAP domain-containing protein [Bacillota bacterium]|nr:CAP domain-containing protein [Bacillota bacterium]MDW7684839.1 CAP domain-containing protein [Bacillota bacterium]
MRKFSVLSLSVILVLLFLGSTASASTVRPPRWPEPAWFAQFFTPAPQPAPEPAQPPVGQAPVEKNALTAAEKVVFDGINKERVQRGLAPLTVNPTLVELARKKSRDMVDNGYFAHRSPTYGTAYNMMRAAGVRYNYAGENLARTTSAKNAVRLFMSSSGHRSTLLNSRFGQTGVGIVQVGRQIYVTQIFIGFK